MDDSSDVEEDPFVDSDEWISAEARQLFRAYNAKDAKAVEVAMFYFLDYLAKTLLRHLRRASADWRPTWPAPDSRWFDGFGCGVPEIPSQGRLRIRNTIFWVQNAWYCEPFEFELELCPRTGTLREYVFRFGDHRPLSEKTQRCEASDPPVGGWGFEFRRIASDSGKPVSPDVVCQRNER